MNPAKPKQLYKETAEATGYSEDIVKWVVSTYYQMVRDKITSAADLRIEIRGLGFFQFKYWEIDNIIDNLEKAIEEGKPGPVHDDRIERLEEIKQLSKKRDKYKEKEKRKKLEKQEYVEAKQNQEGLGEPEADCRRNHEPGL